MDINNYFFGWFQTEEKNPVIPDLKKDEQSNEICENYDDLEDLLSKDPFLFISQGDHSPCYKDDDSDLLSENSNESKEIVTEPNLLLVEQALDDGKLSKISISNGNEKAIDQFKKLIEKDEFSPIFNLVSYPEFIKKNFNFEDVEKLPLCDLKSKNLEDLKSSDFLSPIMCFLDSLQGFSGIVFLTSDGVENYVEVAYTKDLKSNDYLYLQIPLKKKTINANHLQKLKTQMESMEKSTKSMRGKKTSLVDQINVAQEKSKQLITRYNLGIRKDVREKVETKLKQLLCEGQSSFEGKNFRLLKLNDE